jgi:hypothetical protein
VLGQALRALAFSHLKFKFFNTLRSMAEVERLFGGLAIGSQIGEGVMRFRRGVLVRVFFLFAKVEADDSPFQLQSSVKRFARLRSKALEKRRMAAFQQ